MSHLFALVDYIQDPCISLICDAMQSKHRKERKRWGWGSGWRMDEVEVEGGGGGRQTDR